MRKRKQRNLLKRIVLSLMFLPSFFVLMGIARAEEPISDKAGLDQAMGIKYSFSPSGTFISEGGSNVAPTLIAHVDIENAKIIHREKNHFWISFDLVNKRSWVQTDIKYEVAISPWDLFSNSSVHEGNIVEDQTRNEKVYSEKISLKGDTRTNRIVEYNAPNYLSGYYLLSVRAFLPSGLPLGGTLVAGRSVSLEGNNQFLEIVPSSCYLVIENGEIEQGYGRYKTEERIAVNSPPEKLIGVCKAINHFGKPIKVVPSFEIYLHSQYGDKIEELQSDRGEFYFDPGEEKNISFVIPTNFDSQAYNVKITLKNGKQAVSNSVIARYILQGASAVIQNIIFDKANYSKGEIAKVNLFWNDSIDQFYNSRLERIKVTYLQIDLVIKDTFTGQICGQVAKNLNLDENNTILSIPIVTDCANPIVIGSLKNKEDRIFSQKESQILEGEKWKEPFNKKKVAMVFLIVLCIVTIVMFCVLNFKKK